MLTRYVKEDLIIPHNVTFYELIKAKPVLWESFFKGILAVFGMTVLAPPTPGLWTFWIYSAWVCRMMSELQMSVVNQTCISNCS